MSNSRQRYTLINRFQQLVLLLAFSSMLLACGSNNRTYNGKTSSQDKSRLVKLAKQYIGTPYRYGGNSPRAGFDCSGLVQYTHQRLGISLPRTTGDLYRRAMPVPKRSLVPGDLVFFNTKRRSFVSHVGIYLGNNRFIHAPSSGKVVSVASMNNPYWKRRFTSGGRVF